MSSWKSQARRPSNEVGSSRGIGLRTTPVRPRPAPARPEPVLVWPHLVLAEQAVGYVPRDARLREAVYRATSGTGEAWEIGGHPVPLTPCTSR